MTDHNQPAGEGMPEKVWIGRGTMPELGKLGTSLFVVNESDEVSRMAALRREEEDGCCVLKEFIRADLHASRVAELEARIEGLEATVKAVDDVAYSFADTLTLADRVQKMKDGETYWHEQAMTHYENWKSANAERATLEKALANERARAERWKALVCASHYAPQCTACKMGNCFVANMIETLAAESPQGEQNEESK